MLIRGKHQSLKQVQYNEKWNNKNNDKEEEKSEKVIYWEQPEVLCVHLNAARKQDIFTIVDHDAMLF